MFHAAHCIHWVNMRKSLCLGKQMTLLIYVFYFRMYQNNSVVTKQQIVVWVLKISCKCCKVAVNTWFHPASHLLLCTTYPVQGRCELERISADVEWKANYTLSSSPANCRAQIKTDNIHSYWNDAACTEDRQMYQFTIYSNNHDPSNSQSPSMLKLALSFCVHFLDFVKICLMGSSWVH